MRCVRRSFLAAAVASLGLLGLGLSPTPVAAAPYARSHVPGLADLQVVNGTRAFDGNQLPLGL